jgi:DoxX-like family
MTTPLLVSLAALIAVAFAVLGATKIRAVPSMQARAAHVGFSVGAYQRIGVLEVAGAAGVLLGLAIPALGVLAAAGLLLLMVGALGAHLRQHDGVAEMAPALVVTVLLVAYLWLAFGTI